MADPNFAPMYASRNRKVKTDKRDARALCDACHLGAFRPSHRSSDESRLLRKHLAARQVLVQTRSRMISLCRSLLRQEGAFEGQTRDLSCVSSRRPVRSH